MALRALSSLRGTGDQVIKCCASQVRWFADSTKKKDTEVVPQVTRYKTVKETDTVQKYVTKVEPDDRITVAEVEDVGIISGVPEDHLKTRRVRIYCPAKNAMQSGTNNIHYWQIDFDTRERWENPLIGWTSTGDPLSNLKVDFASEQEAIAYCERMNWSYYVQKPNVNSPKPRSYGTNFSWNKRTRVSTK